MQAADSGLHARFAGPGTGKRRNMHNVERPGDHHLLRYHLALFSGQHNRWQTERIRKAELGHGNIEGRVMYRKHVVEKRWGYEEENHGISRSIGISKSTEGEWLPHRSDGDAWEFSRRYENDHDELGNHVSVDSVRAQWALRPRGYDLHSRRRWHKCKVWLEAKALGRRCFLHVQDIYCWITRILVITLLRGVSIVQHCSELCGVFKVACA